MYVSTHKHGCHIYENIRNYRHRNKASAVLLDLDFKKVHVNLVYSWKYGVKQMIQEAQFFIFFLNLAVYKTIIREFI